MLEPVATVIFNTVLSGRSHIGRSIPLHSVVRIVQSTSPRPFTSNFFNPQPRRVKGKARGTQSSDDEYESAILSSQCREWSVQPGSFMSIPRRNQSSVIRHASSSRQKLNKRAGLPRMLTMSLHRHLPSDRASGRLAQTRHSSRIAEGPSSDDSFSSTAPLFTSNPDQAVVVEAEQTIQKFILALKPGPPLDPDEIWSMYVNIEKANALSRLTVQQLLVFTDKIFVYGDAHYNSSSVELSRLFIWGERVKSLLSCLASRIAPLSVYDYWSKCSMARAAALMGQVDECLSHIHVAQKIPLDYNQDVRIIGSYKTLVFYTFRYYDASHVLTMLAREWLSVGSYLLKSSGQWHIGTSQVVGASFRKAIHRLLSRIPRPAVLISSNFTQWGPELSKRIGELLIDAYCHDQLPLHALETFNELKKLQVSIPLDTQLRLIRALVKEDTLGLAKDLFNTIPRGTTYKHYLQTALFLFAHCGDHRRAESYYNSLHQQKFVNERDIGLLMHAYGTQGQAERVRIMFNDFFPVQEDGHRANEPGIQHFGVAIYACAIGGQIGEINYWLEEMVKAGHRPNIIIFNSIMQAFARSGDMASLRAVLDQVKKSDYPPTAVTYVLLMTTLAHRRDVAGVELLYKEAVEERGIVPNRRMVNTLMNAHVIAGSWKGVIRVFDYIRSDAHPRIRLTIELYTTLLKAYVLIGAPFPVVSKIFSKLEDLNVKPDSYTFALLIQSACDAGEMEIAWEIFREMDKLAQSWTSNLYIDVYILTIIMAGYLRAGKRQKAKAVYDDLVARHIQPSAVTFSVMLTSYGNQRSEEAMRIAEAFINELMNIPERPWASPSYGKPSALELVYGPLLKGYTTLHKAEDVERLHNDYSAAGGVETLGTLSALFDVYRRTYQIENVKEMWPAIFALGVEYVKETPVLNTSKDDPSANRLLNNILCLPLSIYIDALSAAGEHEEIAHVWKTFQEHGFSFDAHNWNHLAVTLIRAGQLERAFQVVEHVILPYQDQARDLIASRNSTPTSPLMYSLEDLDKDEEEFNTMFMESQAQLKKRASWRLPSIRRNKRHAMPQLEEDEEAHADDLAYPMHILHQISPAWNVWKIHIAVKRVFLRAIEDLREGYLPRPVGPRRGQLPHSQDFMEDNQETRAEAKELFRQLYDQYPRTYSLLQEFEIKERRRLGRSFGRKYEYGD
ncbi:hypothetical protein F5876DRAFT_78215 [Lentinula aff. lateritia]|uniref:Uncharacterized protein n=1 Tax=Lentinula aff. lateritia TaxID=2804960 RepID=A0ACC1TW08_9AGAR|nr:hypothetical protein F5876DRAFT_78215 [Lentinula aff. lateritia]